MKPVGLIGTGILLLLLGAAVPTYALQDQHEQDAKPPKQEEKAKPAKQEKQAKPEKQQEAKAPKQEQQAKPEKQQEARAVKPEKPAKPEKQQEAKAPKQEQQAKPEKQQEAKGQQEQQQQHAKRSPADEQRQRAVPQLRLSARSEGRIPDDRFRSNFGREHHFRIESPRMVDGYSRFEYSGFWFGFVEPWPDGWYYTDDVYVDFVDGGYYLYNPYYPGVRISISVVN